ncbi:MAG: helix-hairpin-helix domain-containing protein [Lentisphaeria bacterium]|nr:helix-hairpin-helix domain-containing protein [Lentisphaeria bacterium]
MGIKSLFGKFGKKSVPQHPSPAPEPVEDEVGSGLDEASEPQPESPEPDKSPTSASSIPPLDVPQEQEQDSPVVSEPIASPTTVEPAPEPEEPLGKGEDGRFDITPDAGGAPADRARQPSLFDDAPEKPSFPSGDNLDFRASQTFRVRPPSEPDGDNGEEQSTFEPTDELRGSQTIRVRKPSPTPPEPKSPASAQAGDDLRVSQTFKVMRTTDGDGASGFEAAPAAPTVPETEEEVGVELPIEALLRNVPEELHGPSWSPESVVGEYVLFDAEVLLDQLRGGDVRLKAKDLAAILPDGWLVGSPDAPVSLALDLVVAAMPPELLLTTTALDQETEAASAAPDLFRTDTPPPPAPEDVSPPSLSSPSPSPTPAPAPAAAPAAAFSGETISLPCALLLGALPAEVRGEKWDKDTFPETTIPVPREELLGQLSAGRVALDTVRFRSLLPQGWLGDADIECELPLSEVVMAIPPELLRPSTEEDDDVAEAAKMAEFFTADIASPTAPDQTVELPEKAPPAPEEKPDDGPAKTTDDGPEEMLEVPMAALLAGLPPSKRGEQWDQTAFPDGVLSLPRAELLQKLGEGRVPWDVERLRDQVPSGWLAEPPVGEVELDLAQLVVAIPAELMDASQELGEDAQAASEMPQLFHSDTAEVEKVASAVAKPEKTTPPSSVVAESPDEEPTSIDDAIEDGDLTGGKNLSLSSCPEWDGVETSLEMAPRGIDINLADVRELTFLTGIGPTRAEALVAHRQEHGPFANIFELGNMPGIGPSLFRRMTGLALRRRVDRHAIMTNLLGLVNDGSALLAQVAGRMQEEVGALGCVITSSDGIPLAASGDMKGEGGERITALGARFALKTRFHLQRFVDQDADCIMIPGCTPPLMLLTAEDVILIFSLRTSQISKRRLAKARRATREIGWLLSRRAAVINY